jgi:DNA-binding FadR family transcriptional regulator
MNDVAHTRRSTTDLVRSYLKERTFGPNDQLPPERQLAADLGITRSKLRTSLAKLAREGVIWRRVGQGTFMSGSKDCCSNGGASDPHGGLETNPSEILEARLSLEPQIAFLAAQRATAGDFDRMASILAEAREVAGWDEWSDLDKAFHLLIAKASKNALLLSLLTKIQDSQTPSNWGCLSDLPAAVARREDVTREHDEIFRALRTREAREAAAAMRRHLEEVRQALLGPFAPL